MAPPPATLARETVMELERMTGGRSAGGEPSPVMRQTPAEPAAEPQADDAAQAKPRPKPRDGGGARAKGPFQWSDADLRRALLEDSEVESIWVKFATQVKIETRERLNAYVLHGKRKRFNSTRIQDVVDAALSRFLDEQGFGREPADRDAA